MCWAPCLPCTALVNGLLDLSPKHCAATPPHTPRLFPHPGQLPNPPSGCAAGNSALHFRRPPPPLRLRYEARAAHAQNLLGKRLFELIARKKTNLSVAADVTTPEAMLELAEQVGVVHWSWLGGVPSQFPALCSRLHEWLRSANAWPPRVSTPLPSLCLLPPSHSPPRSYTDTHPGPLDPLPCPRLAPTSACSRPMWTSLTCGRRSTRGS